MGGVGGGARRRPGGVGLMDDGPFYYNARTRKATTDPRGPILHALRVGSKRRGRTTRRAACGAGVRPEWRGPWDSRHMRACDHCERAIRRGEAL